MAGAAKPNTKQTGVFLSPVLVVRDQVVFPGLVTTIHVAREISRIALDMALQRERLLWVVTQIDMAQELPGATDLNSVGTICEILHHSLMPDQSVRLTLRGLKRAQALEVKFVDETYLATVSDVKEDHDQTLETTAVMRTVKDSFAVLAGHHKSIPPESIEQVIHADKTGPLADVVLHFLPVPVADKQRLLEERSHKERLNGVLTLIKKEEEILLLEKSIHERVQSEITESQREFYLREQLRAIQKELDSRDQVKSEVEKYTERTEQLDLPARVREAALREIKHLEQSAQSSPEATVSRLYLDTLLSLPWDNRTPDEFEVQAVETQLDANHYGLLSVKERILEFLAVRKLSNKPSGTVLCFVGPPGVGKTSIAKSIANALGRKLAFLSLGGVRDESEIRGHRRTYVGSMPGRIINGLRECGSSNPVMVLDELDKIAANGHGDPAHALLEVLDPQQNQQFIDHYLDLPIDLSDVFFIATANVLDMVPSALRDRLEVIEFPGYTDQERTEIGLQHILPDVFNQCGLNPDQIEVTPEAVRHIVEHYTRESGVRTLRRDLFKLGRKLARDHERNASEKRVIRPQDLESFLGILQPLVEIDTTKPEIGLIHGLVVAPYGGDMMDIEVAITKTSNHVPKLVSTGSMGQVMQESAQAALTCVRQHLDATGVDWKSDVHVHVSNAAIPKDGPSAGLGMALAMLSVFLKQPIPGDLAVTGEISLRGRVSGISGVREKLLAAKRYGIKRVILPAANVRELATIEPEVLDGLEIIEAGFLADAANAIFGHAHTVSMR